MDIFLNLCNIGVIDQIEIKLCSTIYFLLQIVLKRKLDMFNTYVLISHLIYGIFLKYYL